MQYFFHTFRQNDLWYKFRILTYKVTHKKDYEMQLNGRFLILFFFIPLLSCSSQDDYDENYVRINDIEKKDTVFFSYDYFMSLTPSASSPQGAACYGDYFIQGFAGNAII